MVDVAALSFQVDSRPLKEAVRDLTSLDRAGKTAARSMGQAARTTNAVARDIHAAARGWQSVAGGASRAETAMSGAARQATRVAQPMKGAGFATANLAAQFNDIGVMLASGQSPLLLAAQQGTQINQVLTQMRASGAPLRQTLVSAFSSIISPMSLLTFGLIGGGAAITQFALEAINAGRDTREFGGVLDDVNDRLSTLERITVQATAPVEELSETYGRLAESIRGVASAQRELRFHEANEAARNLAQGLTEPADRLLGGPRRELQHAFGLAGTAETGGFRFERRPEVRRGIGRIEEFQALQARAGAEADPERRLEILQSMRPVLAELVSFDNERNEIEREIESRLLDSIDATARLIALKERGLDVDKSAAREAEKRFERDLRWSDQQLKTIRDREFLARQEFIFGRDSAEIENARADQARLNFVLEVERTELSRQRKDFLIEEFKRLQDSEALLRKKTHAEREAAQAKRESEAREREQRREREQEQRRAEENARRIAREHERAMTALHGAEISLASPYEQAVDAARQWRDATIASLDETDARYAEYVGRVQSVYSATIIQAAVEEADRRLQVSRRWQDGIRRGLDSYAQDAVNVGAQIEGATVNAFRGMEDALASFVTTGKLSFRDFANSVIQDLVRIAIRTQITGPLAAGLFGGLGGLFGGAGHGGATALAAGTPAELSLGVGGFADGGRARSGLALVGERGPELVDFRQPAQVYSNERLRSALAGGNGGNAKPGGDLVINIGPIQSTDGPGVRAALDQAIPRISAAVYGSIQEDGGRPSSLRSSFRRG